ncbi:MAG: LolA-like outer membrane lipoprotein chaperone [Campylobacterota bacterium]|nr:LolA-like outer membrane lipoprotein chaperone [Campylobacterota bacterium]
MKVLLWVVSFGMVLNASVINLPENFKANFTQKISNVKNKSINYSGKVRFSDKSLLKWQYLKPTKKEVCTNGLELWVVDHDLEQVSNYYINKGFNFARILQKAKKHSKNIYVAHYESKSYTIQLNSKKQLHSIAYFDELDNKVQIVFKNIKYGKGKLSSKSMQCNYPKNYDRIEG